MRPNVIEVKSRSKPGLMYILFKGERIVGKINVRDYTVGLPEKSAADVVKRVLTLGGAGSGHPSLKTEFVAEFALGEAGPPSFDITILEGTTGVELSLVDFDNAGLASEPSTRALDAIDTEAPNQPGELDAQFTGERVIDDGNTP